jgi:hypothetical protein
LREALERLAAAARLVFVAGLPGTGKSLVIRELAQVAAKAGRVVHLLQWDVARPVFEASAAGHRYPIVNGVTHPIVRKAVGLWARRALAAWQRRHAGTEHLLIGETPLVGGRLMELVRPVDDAAESVLNARACRFVIVVPSIGVRRFIEGERDRRAAHPRHAREREDAPPAVMRALWREIVVVAHQMKISVAGPDGPYDPEVYRRVYERLLGHRHTDAIRLETILPTTDLSVYDVTVPHRDLLPDAREVAATISDAEALGADDVERWWTV